MKEKLKQFFMNSVVTSDCAFMASQRYCDVKIKRDSSKSLFLDSLQVRLIGASVNICEMIVRTESALHFQGRLIL